MQLTLDNYLSPSPGARPVTQLTTPDFLKILRIMEEHGKIVTAHRA
jgi:hypothetical protein